MKVNDTNARRAHAPLKDFIERLFALITVAAFASLVSFAQTTTDTALLAVPALLVLLLRAAFGFCEAAQRASAKQIGIGELAYGAMTVLAVAAGHLLAA